MNFFLYYKTSGELNYNSLPEHYKNYKLIVFKPNLFKLTLHKEFIIRSIITYLIFKGNLTVVYLLEDSEVVHYSYVTGKCIRFPFMKKNEKQIGPCYTNPKYRGQGIYKSMLKILCNWNDISKTKTWIYTRSNNLISKKAIESADFKFHSEISSHTLINILK